MVNFWVVPYYSPGFTLKATLSETTYTDIDFFNDFSGTTGDWYIVVQLAADVDGNPTISTVSDVLAITASVAGAQATAALSPGASGGDLFYGGSTDTPQPFAFPPPNPPPGPGPVGNIAC